MAKFKTSKIRTTVTSPTFWLAVLFTGVSSVLIYVDATGRVETRASLMTATAPVGKLLYWFDEVKKAESERAELEELVARRNILWGRAEDLKRENDILRGHYGIGAPAEAELLFARVVGREVETWRRGFVVDRGARDGVAREMPVVGPNGLAGYVKTAAASVSLVEIITSDQMRCAVEHSPTGKAGIYYADEKGIGHLSYFDRDTPVKVGDLIVTSGLSGKFPAGLIVGYVSAIRRPADSMYLEAEVAPAEDLDTTRNVFIMMRTPVPPRFD